MAGFNFALKTTKGKPAGARFKPALLSVWDAATGAWQNRKADWLAIGIKSEVGRGGFGNYHENEGTTNVDHYREQNYARQCVEKGELSEADFLRLFPKWNLAGENTSGIATPFDIKKRLAALEGMTEGELTQNFPTARMGKYINGNEKYRPTMATTTVCATDWMKRGTDAGGSVFNPALCEALYLHFTRPGWEIRDPFAGGSVRGIVAAGCDRIYHGMELREEQVEANRAQAEVICEKGPFFPRWEIGDSRGILGAIPGEHDFLFSCPPYGDLEVYSNKPEDISAVGWAEFLQAYHQIIGSCASTLRDNRFACFVVGNYRDQKTGYYRDLVGETVKAMESAGLQWVGDMVLVTPRGSLPIRATKQFNVSRKAGKTHQNILLFCKGDPSLAAQAVGE